jgi:hypothetical protein
MSEARKKITVSFRSRISSIRTRIVCAGERVRGRHVVSALAHHASVPPHEKSSSKIGGRKESVSGMKEVTALEGRARKLYSFRALRAKIMKSWPRFPPDGSSN